MNQTDDPKEGVSRLLQVTIDAAIKAGISEDQPVCGLMKICNQREEVSVPIKLTNSPYFCGKNPKKAMKQSFY